MIKIKEYLNFETILLFILSVISGAFVTMFFVFYDAPDNAGIVNAIFDFVKLFLHYPLFFASPFVVIILGILIKKLTINRRLIVCLFKIKYSVKKQTILSIFFYFISFNSAHFCVRILYIIFKCNAALLAYGCGCGNVDILRCFFSCIFPVAG